MKLTFLFLLLASSISCSTYDPKTGTYEIDEDTKDSRTLSEKQSAVPPHRGGVGISGGINDPVIGAVAGVVGLIQLSSYPAGASKPKGIYGICKEQIGNESRPCSNTYVDIKNLKTDKTVKVWIDSDGSFFLNVPNPDKFSIQAFKDMGAKAPRTSDLLTVTAPREIQISIALGNQ